MEPIPGQLGYLFHPVAEAQDTGSFQLDVLICRTPTHEHYDPERASFRAVGPGGELCQTLVGHPWYGQKQLRVAPGYISLRDRKQKAVEGFTFGGEVTIATRPDCTVLRFSSPAPILELSEVFSASRAYWVTTLVHEFEGLLARARVPWRGDDHGFEQRLASVEPATLFLAGLAAVAARLEETPLAARTERYRALCRLVRQGRASLPTGAVHSGCTPSLEELFARNA